MSGIAEVMHNLGYAVQGSDLADSSNIKRLRELGINIMIGHKEENLGDASILVVSSAIKADNSELESARNRRIPIVRRAEMLGELMRLKSSIAVGGTHGKTTTTSLIASLLENADIDPTVINGGIINAWGTNARLGSSEWMIVEADESDGTFVKLPSTIAVVTNIDKEHMDHYASFESVKEAFVTFVERIPFYGLAVLCIDDLGVQDLIPKVADRRILTYGMSPQADIRINNIKFYADSSSFDVIVAATESGIERTIHDVLVPMVGSHNILNSAAAVTVALELGLTDEIIKEGLKKFAGVKRRFTQIGIVNDIKIIDDYGHHPAEIIAALNAARVAAPNGKVMAVVQPHRYSRLESLFDDFCKCFNQADIVIITEVYAAGEMPIEGFSRDSLVAGVRAHGHRNVLALEDYRDLAQIIDQELNAGDLVICLGAGDISICANKLPAELGELNQVTNVDR